MLGVSNCRNYDFIFFFLSLLAELHIPPLLSPSTFGSISFIPFSHVPISQASSMKVSCHCVRHICIAVPRGKQRLKEKRCVWIAWDRNTKRENEQIRKSDLSFTKIMDAWVTGKHHFTHHLAYYTIVVLYIYFFPLTQKHTHLNVQKSNTNTTICTSKCCHIEITERVIHPHLPPSLWASLLLMASSFFLCSLYFPSDSGACFIVFCHVSVIAPTAFLMLSI